MDWEGGRQIRRHIVGLHVIIHTAATHQAVGLHPCCTRTQCALGISAPGGRVCTENSSEGSNVLHKLLDHCLLFHIWTPSGNCIHHSCQKNPLEVGIHWDVTGGAPMSQMLPLLSPPKPSSCGKSQPAGSSNKDFLHHAVNTGLQFLLPRHLHGLVRCV